MATINLSSPATCITYSFPSLSRRNSPNICLHSRQKISQSFYSISVRSRNPARLCSPRFIVSAVKKLSEADLVSVSPDPDGIAGVFPSESGVYGVFDRNGDLQFVGISRNIAASVSNHLKSLPELCSSVKVGVVSDPDKTALTQAWRSWMEEHIAATGNVPPGNQSGNNTWVRQQPKKKADLKLTPGKHVKLTVPLEQLIDRLVKENKVVAFIKGSRSAPLCGFSQKVVGILETEGIDYESVDVLDEECNNGLRETLKSYSNWPTFPQIFVNGELVGGCDILTSMHDKGELAGLVKK
ncbi:bifunctional monothiol glutaredoxin-S16, chloroplastic [Impatiens glandulifera]|uniref:bifunctional monothiol glutaredoxin-S16, chloroplastic n=1 Tax=Impatiens glandulifera TaxID=253017 RepID=UPI001FB13A0C|nr:bifunctional monothiol glutaredoxin-S16, chloroplastic [Impatiens glandulifera]